MNWRQNPARVAWVVLTASFLTCCLLAVAVPVGARAFLLHATRAKTAFVTATTGTAQLWPPGANDPTAVTDRRTVGEGGRIITDGTAKALLTLAADEAGDRVLATIQLSPDTTVALQAARTPRFQLSPDAHRVDLALPRGRLFIATQRVDDRDVRLRLTTPHAEIVGQVGTFDVSVSGDETLVRVRSGVADIVAEETQVTASAGQRVSVAAGRQPGLPLPDTVNLVVNGNFDGDLLPLWQSFAEVEPGFVAGEVEMVTDDRRNAVRFSRRTEDGKPNRVGIQQVVDRDVQGYDNLTLRLDLKLLYQSVPGGGYLGTEYPLMIDVAYTDVYGKDLHWYKGFYYADLPPGSTYPVPPSGDQLPTDSLYVPPSAERVPLGSWYTYESSNLFELFKATRPAHINSITLYAIGHDYESLVSNVELAVR